MRSCCTPSSRPRLSCTGTNRICNAFEPERNMSFVGRTRSEIFHSMRLAIIGAGGWGTALAIVLSPRFERIRLWVHEPDLAARIAATRENDLYLAGLRVPGNVCPGTSIPWALEDADIVAGVMPSARPQAIRRNPPLSQSLG